MKISKVEATYGDAITIQKSTNVWVDHCDLSAVRGDDKDFYDGLVDLSHAADWVTISHTYLHDHVSDLVFLAVWNANLLVYSPRDRWSATPTRTLPKTWAHFTSHTPTTTSTMFEAVVLFFALAQPTSSSLSHNIFFWPSLTPNSGYYDTMDTGLNSRMNAQALIQSSVFTNVGKKAIFSESSSEVGYVVAEDVVLNGESQNTAPKGTLSASKIPYKFTLLGSGKVASTVPGQAGQKLSF